MMGSDTSVPAVAVAVGAVAAVLAELANEPAARRDPRDAEAAVGRIAVAVPRARRPGHDLLALGEPGLDLGGGVRDEAHVHDLALGLPVGAEDQHAVVAGRAA